MVGDVHYVLPPGGIVLRVNKNKTLLDRRGGLVKPTPFPPDVGVFVDVWTKRVHHLGEVCRRRLAELVCRNRGRRVPASGKVSGSRPDYKYPAW